jgi:hypothetical protein
MMNPQTGRQAPGGPPEHPAFMVPALHGLARVGANSIALWCGKNEIEFNMETVANVDIQ